jgi:hypothetical protein
MRRGRPSATARKVALNVIALGGKHWIDPSALELTGSWESNSLSNP